MRISRKHFSIANKTALGSWKFKEGDLVIVTKGRSANIVGVKGHKGKVGNIEKVKRNPRNPTVLISGVTRTVKRMGEDSKKHTHKVAVPIHISNIAHANGPSGGEKATRVKFQQYVRISQHGKEERTKRRVYLTENQETVPLTPGEAAARQRKDRLQAALTQQAATKAQAAQNTQIRGFATFASAPLLQKL